MSSQRPFEVILLASLRASLAEAMPVLLDALRDAGMPDAERFAIPDDALSPRRNERGLDKAVTSLWGSNARRARLEWWRSASALLYWRTREQPGKPLNLSMRICPRDEDLENVKLFVRAADDVQHAFFRRDCLLRANLFPTYMALCVPDPPVVRHNAYSARTTAREVAEAYEDPSVFWKAWQSCETKGEEKLVTRGLELVEGSAYLELIAPHQWAMARAAKPGLTKYYLPQPNEDEKPLFEAGTPRLHTVGYAENERTLELSCVLEPGDHIRGWEIYNVWNLVQEGALPDGRTLETLRVVFLDRWAAEQEKRPLLDVGARVFASEDETLVELTDP